MMTKDSAIMAERSGVEMRASMRKLPANVPNMTPADQAIAIAIRISKADVQKAPVKAPASVQAAFKTDDGEEKINGDSR